MASGLPSVVVNAGGAPDVVGDGVSGIVVEPDAQAFVEVIQRLRDRPDVRRRMSCNARNMAEERPWSDLMAQLEGYYREAYKMNQRFKRLFGSTNYHRPLSIPARLVRRPRAGTHS